MDTILYGILIALGFILGLAILFGLYICYVFVCNVTANYLLRLSYWLRGTDPSTEGSTKPRL